MKQSYRAELGTIRAFRRSLRALEREIGLSLDLETSCCGVTSAQCHFLLEAAEKPNASLGELSSALALDSSTLSRTADSLLAAGYIRRAAVPENRRKVSISLEGKGADKVDSINKLCDDSVRRLFSYLPEDKRETVAESVALLAEALRRKRADEAGRPCSGGEERP